MSSVIGVDVDCVVADMLPEWLRRYNEDFEDNLRVEDIRDWDMTRAVKPECGRQIYQYLSDERFYDRVQPVPGAIEAIDRLHKAGHEIVYVTSCPTPESASAKIEWLNWHGFAVYGDIWTVSGRSPFKGRLNMAVLIDDHVDNLNGAAVCNGTEGILFRSPAPYTQVETAHEVADSWDEVLWLCHAS